MVFRFFPNEIMVPPLNADCPAIEVGQSVLFYGAIPPRGVLWYYLAITNGSVCMKPPEIMR